MNQNAQTVPPSVLQQVIQEHLHNRKQEPFYDKDWKLTWSRKEGTTLFTYFLYDEQNRPVETGEVILSCAGPYQLTTLRRQTRQQVIDFILGHQCRTNVLRTIYKEDAPATAIQQPAATAESTPTLQASYTKQHCFADDLLQSIFGTQGSTRQQPYSPSYTQPLLPDIHQLLWHKDIPYDITRLHNFVDTDYTCHFQPGLHITLGSNQSHDHVKHGYTLRPPLAQFFQKADSYPPD